MRKKGQHSPLSTCLRYGSLEGKQEKEGTDSPSKVILKAMSARIFLEGPRAVKNRMRQPRISGYREVGRRLKRVKGTRESSPPQTGLGRSGFVSRKGTRENKRSSRRELIRRLCNGN